MTFLCTTFLPTDRVHAIPAAFVKKIKRIPVIDKVKEVHVAAITTLLSTDPNIVLKFKIFLLLFCFVVFISEVCDHFFYGVN